MLKIFGDDPANLPKPRASFDDVVGRFRSGYTVDGEPAPLTTWRVTTADTDVANAVADLLSGSVPAVDEEAKGDDNIEVFTDVADVDVIIEGPWGLRQRMVYFREGELVYASDGEFILDEHNKPTDERDPDAALTFKERKAKAEAGDGPAPDIDFYFRLADAPELGLFLFKTTSFSVAYDLALNRTSERLAEIGGQTTATLKLKPVAFTSRTGETKGQRVEYTATRIELTGEGDK
jgi:hypothetical protein